MDGASAAQIEPKILALERRFCCNSPVSGPSMYERLGGAVGLKSIIDDFVDRVMDDMMIGFFFRQIEREKLKRLEFQFASGHLGGPSEYEGRPIQSAHSKHPIMGGQFNRRLKILENTLRDHRVEQDIISGWLAHNESLRSHITQDGTFECNGALPDVPDKSTSQ